MLPLGEADIGVATETLAGVPERVSFLFYSWRYTRIIPKGHPPASLDAATREAVAEYPLITYHEGFTGRERDDHLQLIDTGTLFAQNVTQIAVRRGRYLRGYAYRFIELCSPGLTEAAVRAALAPPQGPDVDV